VKVTGRKEKRDAKAVFTSSGSEFPQGLNDYQGEAPDGPIYTESNAYGIATACTTQKPAKKDGNEPASQITARRLVWAVVS